MQMSELQDKVGEQIGVSDWYLLDQDRINLFAAATDDHQFIHVDPERAKDSPFGQTIAHGFLTLSLLAAALEKGFPTVEHKMLVNYGFEKVRFLAPVKSGKRVRCVFNLAALDEKRPGQWQVNVDASIEIEGEDKPAVIANWILQVFT
jgi:acyl dehydratase